MMVGWFYEINARRGAARRDPPDTMLRKMLMGLSGSGPNDSSHGVFLVSPRHSAHGAGRVHLATT